MTRQSRSVVEERAPALLVYGQGHSLDEVKDFLDRQGVETSRARDCAEADGAFRSQTPPILAFTATDLPDGSWEDILDSADRACSGVPVVVVSNHEDVALYLRVLEAGGADCVAPPFSDREVARVLRAAMLTGFLATCARPASNSSREGLISDAQNHMRSGILPAQA
jgi:DNA-binding response OmpR family regulator